MNIDYEAELKAIADAQKRQKQADLEAAKNSTLNTINQQQDALIPTFQTQRQQKNVSSQIGAKNFAEYLARRGQTSQGLAYQAELSRNNTLGNAISNIDTQESSALKDFANQRTTAETGYQNNLNSAYNDINTNYMSNLYTAKQNEQARQDTLKQQAFDNWIKRKAKEEEELPLDEEKWSSNTASQINTNADNILDKYKTFPAQYVNMYKTLVKNAILNGQMTNDEGNKILDKIGL